MTHEFTETTLATKFGNFNIRVYADTQGKETVALCTEQLDITTPALVRIHSECMTGAAFGSMHCDCGEQLAESLTQINKSVNGILIYLRQEGRGIGLFEKIKSYALQKKGYDTFEANVLLGHHPDSRTYEKAKMVLSDLEVTRVRLLTNNPAKMEELAKLGIEVVERVPLIISPNKHNERYLSTKQEKFNHRLRGENTDNSKK